MIHILPPGSDDKPEGAIVVNPTSTLATKPWEMALSPFFAGPVHLWSGTARNVENAWQFSKVYAKDAKGIDIGHVNSDGTPTPTWHTWHHNGIADKRAHRYPMGKGAVPLYSYWPPAGAFDRLDYIEARKHIYLPLYRTAIYGTDAWKTLLELARSARNADRPLVIVDFDAYNHHRYGMSLVDVLDCSSRKMGHGFMLAMMLEEHLSADAVRVASRGELPGQASILDFQEEA